jgi:hypothetical protein
VDDLADSRTPNDPAAENDGEGASSQQREAEAARKREANLALMAATISSEPVDLNWSTERETHLADALRDPHGLFTVESVACASTLCALQLTGSTNSTGSEILQTFSRSVAWGGEMTMQYDTNTYEGVAYLARDGHSLPKAD